MERGWSCTLICGGGRFCATIPSWLLIWLTSFVQSPRPITLLRTLSTMIGDAFTSTGLVPVAGFSSS